jgi:peptidoglycan/LPS O-acetylase OafA/YrhL
MPAIPFEIGNKPLFFAGQFLKDWVLGLLLGFVFWLFPLTDKIQKSTPAINKFRKVADLTYTIYLIHLPILYLLKVIFDYKQADLAQYFIVSSIMLILASSIGFLLESKRHFWTNLFEKIFYRQKTKVNYCE